MSYFKLYSSLNYFQVLLRAFDCWESREEGVSGIEKSVFSK